MQSDQPYRPSPGQIHPAAPQPSGLANGRATIPHDRLLRVSELWSLSLRALMARIVPIALIFLIARLPLHVLEEYLTAYHSESRALGLFSSFVQTGAALWILYLLYDWLQGTKLRDANEISNAVLKKVGPAFLTQILAALGVVIGLLFLLVPGVLLFVYLAFILPAIALRVGGAIDACRYSFRLVRNSWGDVFTRLTLLALPVLTLLVFLFGVIFAAEMELFTLEEVITRPIYISGMVIIYLLVELLILPLSAGTLILFLNMERLRDAEHDRATPVSPTDA